MTLPFLMPNCGPSALRLAGALLLALSVPALAQEMSRPIGAEEFQAYTEGRTLSYNFSGTPYGTEEYLPDRRVRWAFRDQECQDGVWYERNGNICFLYDNDPTDEQCWSFYATSDGLRGVFQGPDGPTTELYEVEQSSAPLSCMGPEVGV
ncbi:hypothetical protein [Pararhodobacter zhoushanensis]|uniref:Uncharacterized protein n=1 Tax=Pararhodobacter zhoushanensis TaxID=2479545 RepID=A0ABT3GWS6_9RHOB|nr:hypothetical protein [Pararhodobacter zhoushanensis]MCW1931960.1 hypothetical protein [Pararhodobacter zhoushanensis]